MKKTLIAIITAGWILSGQAASTEIILGQSAPLSGSFSKLGREYRDGAQLHFDLINRQGGINGRSIRLMTLDDGYVPKRAAENTRELIERHKAVAMFGHMFTSAVRASFEVSKAAGVPYVAPYTGYDDLFEKHHSSLFLTRVSFSSELDALLKHVKAMGQMRVVLMRYDSAPGVVLQKEFDDKMRALELSPLGSATMKLNSRDPAAAVAALVEMRPSCIILGVSGADAVEFIRQFNAKAIAKPVQYMARSLVGGHQLVSDLKDDARGVVMSQLVPSPFNGKTRVAREYQKDIKLAQKAGQDFRASYLGFEGYIAAKVMVEGLRRAGADLSHRNLIQAMETMREWDAGDFPVTFTPADHKGSRFVTVTVIGPNGHFIE